MRWSVPPYQPPQGPERLRSAARQYAVGADLPPGRTQSPWLTLLWLRKLLEAPFSSVNTRESRVVFDSPHSARRTAVVSRGHFPVVLVSISLVSVTAVFILLHFLSACLLFWRLPGCAQPSNRAGHQARSARMRHFYQSMRNRNRAALWIILRSRPRLTPDIPGLVASRMRTTMAHFQNRKWEGVN